MRACRIGRSLSWLLVFAVANIEGVFLPLSVLAQPGSAAPRIGVNDRDADRGIRINPGDVVSISVFPAEEYSREVTVQPDGKVELALIGSILVKGLSSKELQTLLQDKYSQYVANPRITVNVRKFAGRRVAILGEVRSPGFYEFRDGMKVLELVALAGGLTDMAKPSRARILRYGGPSGGASVPVNLKAVLDGKLERDPSMAPGDTVYVPKGHFTVGAQWTNANILPWATVMTAAATIAVIVHQNTAP